MPVFQGPINPLEYFTGTGAYEQPDPMQVIEKERRRREEERRLAEEEFRKRIMETLAKPAEQPEEDGSQILSRLLERRFTPEREERLNKQRSQTPEDIAAQYQQQFFGTPPKSTIGKVGKSALTIGALMSGMQVPNFNKLAMERWIEQQKAASTEESGEMRALATEVKGISDARKTQQQATAAHEKNQTVAMMGMANQEIARQRAQIEQEKTDAIRAGVDEKIAEGEAKRKTAAVLSARLGTLSEAIPLAKGRPEGLVALAQAMANSATTEKEKKTAEDFGRTVATIMEAQKYQAPTPMQTVPTQRTDVIKTPGAPDQFQSVPGVRFIPPKPGRGTAPGTLGNQIFGGLQPIDPNAPAQPQAQPQAPQVPQPQPPAMLQRPAPQPQIQPQWRRQSPDFSDRAPDQPKIESELFLAGTGDRAARPVSPVTARETQAAMKALNDQKGFLDLAIDADLDGKLSTGLRNRPLDFLGENLTTNIKNQLGLGSKDQLTYEVLMSQKGRQAMAAYMNTLYGKQISKYDISASKDIFPTMANDKDQLLGLAWMNAVAPRVIGQLESLKILNRKTAGKLQIQSVLKEKLDEFIKSMKEADLTRPRWEKQGKEVAKKLFVNPTTSPDNITEEIIRRSYPTVQPGDMITEDYQSAEQGSYGGDKVRFRIPIARDKATNDAERERRRKKALEDARKLRGQED